ncbi:thiamine-phosphate kinase [Candidatus Bipolaricaulota bacterium]|nr:thiamine-phosphate kinase [Candidatus Bipolaricaulota bacterium]
MRETDVLRLINARVIASGDDAAVVPFKGTNLILTTDMLHRESDFPTGTTTRTIGWRSVAVSLSDLAAMGARPLGVLLALADPDLDEELISGVLDGALACCKQAGAQLVGGDIDRQRELTLVSTGVGEAERPVRRDGAMVGDLICVTGELGRTATGLNLFSTGDTDRANDLFCFPPRLEWGMKLAGLATSMIDISDGLAHSLHLMASQSRVGFRVRWKRLPIIPLLSDQISGAALRDAVLFTGEDYELLFTVPADLVSRIDPTVSFTMIGHVTEHGFTLDDEQLPDRGYEH